MKISRPVAFRTGAVMAPVLGSGTDVAATGGKFIPGTSHSATTTTKLTNTRGTALSVAPKPCTAALTASSPTKFGNLNSDRIDGLDSTQLALAGGQTNMVFASGLAVDMDDEDLTQC